ncbi:hypothetical protein [Virgibacillus doumboii]|uniref:hypothetical protein n=1 Tax=Virgibacillus doumboii TaxID=2697503 RepID=UPI0013DF9365|nr:hypothetical protein [Virgibacillus doumboii]
MKAPVKEKTTIIIENANRFLEEHPLIKSHEFIFNPDEKEQPVNLTDEIQFMDNQELNRNIIYLYKPSQKKQQSLMRLRNLYLPESRLIPVPYPSNDAEAVHLLNLLTGIEDKTFNEILFDWSLLNSQMENYTIEHAKANKLRGTGKPIASMNKYNLIQNNQSSKKISKGHLNELIKVLSEKTKGHIPLIVQETVDNKYSFYSSLDEITNIENTIKISVSAVKNIGVENNG